VAVTLGGTAADVLLTGTDASRPLSFLAHRGVEMESLPASLLWLAHTVSGAPLTRTFEVNVMTLVAPLAPSMTLAALVLAGVVALAALWQQWLGRLTLSQSCLVLILALLLGSKVFSPQYLLWASPLVALEFGVQPLWSVLWGVVCVLTALAFPTAYEGALVWDHRAAWELVTALCTARNLVIALFVALMLGWPRPVRLTARAASTLAMATRRGA
jgi:hypothetical protein